MEGFDAFRLWVAFTQHFTTRYYDITKTHGRVKCKFLTYLSRDDYKSFENMARRFTKGEYVAYLVSNCMYGNPKMVYETPEGIANYNQYLNRRKNFRELLATDFKTLIRMNIDFDDGISIVRALTRNQISFETVVVLNKYSELTKQFKGLPQEIILDPLLIRIDKSINFVKIPLDVETYILNKLKKL